MAIVELSEKKYKNGRRPFKAVLYELQPPESVENGIGTKYNKNGITFLEEYCAPQLGSITDMSVRVEFLDENRTIICGHGETGVNEDGLITFRNASVVGHFTRGYIDDIDYEGETKRCVCGEGYLDEMCYPEFVANLEEDLNNGVAVEGSVEIFKAKGNTGIVYMNGWRETGRIPVEFIHSGWDMVMNPADTSSIVLELNENQNKEDKQKMDGTIDMKEITSAIKETISEINSKESVLEEKISEQNSVIEQKDSVIAEKDVKISELNASVEKLQKALEDTKTENETAWEQIEILRKEIAKAKVAEKLGEVDEALSEFNEDEKAVAKEDIDKLKSDINSCENIDELNEIASEVNSIKSKICMNIVAQQKAAEKQASAAEPTAETNSEKVEDIFSEVCESIEVVDDDEDVSIF